MGTQDRGSSGESAWGSIAGVVGSILFLFNLALAYPLLALTGSNAEFFVAHDASWLTILLLVLLLTVAIPGVLAGAVLAIGRFSPVAAQVLHLAVLASLVAALAVQVLKQGAFESQLPGPVVLSLALALGIAGAAGYHFLPAVRLGTRFGLVVPFLVMISFAMTDAQRLLLPEDTERAGLAIDHPVPVAMVVFDEFPITSILTEDLDIDAELFPNFSRLAQEGTWYRNATTVDTHTRWAVPALIDGYRPSRDTLPTVGDHPDNLFRLLGDSYDVHAYESMTALCPDDVCRDAPSPSTTTEIAGIVSDLGVVAAHVLSPTQWIERLPPLDEGWANFGDGAVGDGEETSFTWDKEARLGDLVGQFREWTADLPSAGQDNVLAFAHSLLAHKPWRYLPTGQDYPNVMFTALESGAWTDDPWLLAQGYQRHLLQVQAADSMLGELLSALEANGTYDRAMVIVAADHGMSLQPGVSPRRPLPKTLVDIAAVPLFVKYPAQTKGEVVIRPVQTIDVVPTILDVLDVESERELEGRSLLAESVGDRARVMSSGAADDGVVELPGSIDDHLRRKAAYKLDLLGLPPPGNPSRLYHMAPPDMGGLIGRRVDELVTDAEAPFSTVLRRADEYEDIDPAGATIPALIGGDLDVRLPDDSPATIAVAVNGRVAGVTRTLNRGAQQRPTEFSAMVDPKDFRAGRNEVSFYVVDPRPGDDFGLVPITRRTDEEA